MTTVPQARRHSLLTAASACSLYAGDHFADAAHQIGCQLCSDDAIYAHGSDAMMSGMLDTNPVNIHTHGMIVEPRKATAADPTYGDYVFVLGYPAGKLPPMVSPDETATDKPIQYDIYIPQNHPSGIYWFHPHVHGLTINHLSEGLSGIITIGRVTDYASAPNGTAIPERFFILKDMQVMGNGKVIDQEGTLAVLRAIRSGVCAAKWLLPGAEQFGWRR